MEKSQTNINFIEYYNLIKLQFESNSNFTILIENNGKFDQPDKSCVYVVWKTINNNEKNNIHWILIKNKKLFFGEYMSRISAFENKCGSWLKLSVLPIRKL